MKTALKMNWLLLCTNKQYILQTSLQNVGSHFTYSLLGKYHQF